MPSLAPTKPTIGTVRNQHTNGGLDGLRSKRVAVLAPFIQTLTLTDLSLVICATISKERESDRRNSGFINSIKCFRQSWYTKRTFFKRFFAIETSGSGRIISFNGLHFFRILKVPVTDGSSAFRRALVFKCSADRGGFIYKLETRERIELRERLIK